MGIDVAEKLFPGVPNVGVFDTEFGMPLAPEAYLYPLPYSLYEELRIRRYDQSDIFEFDSLDELRGFDASYIDATRSQIIRQLAARLGGGEAALTDFHARKACGSTQAVGFTFRYQNETYQYDYKNKEMEKING